MEKRDILEKVLGDVNSIFGKVFTYNTKLLKLCNDDSYEPTHDDIFDFYITSQAISFLKNFFYQYIESPGIFLNARCIIEGLALKEAFRTDYFDFFNLELLKKQDALIEYVQYKKFKDCYEFFLIPDELKQKYDESYEFYRKTLCSTSESDLKKIVNSQVPFICDPKLSFRKIIEDNLGTNWAMQYSLISSIIHPTSNENINTEGSLFALMDTIELLKKEYANLECDIDLRGYSNFIFSSKDAEKFLNSIKSECTELENVIADFEKNFGNNYVSNTFHVISMTIQEMAFDTIFGFTEQVKSKWKVMVELLAGFYEVYLNSDDLDNSYKLLQYHEDVVVARSCGMNDEKEKAIAKAYDFYKAKYPDGVCLDEFSHKYETTTGWTIDGEGHIKTLTQLVNQLADLFQEDEKGMSTGHAIKLNYVEAQMVSHANGYLWFANTGAWTDVNGLFIAFNQMMSFICFYMSRIYADGYKETNQYKDKKTSNILKHAGTHIRDNSKSLYDLLLKRAGIPFGSKEPKIPEA